MSDYIQVDNNDNKIVLKRIEITICSACLDGVGSEYHVPGCALYLHAVDLPIHQELYEVKEVMPVDA